MEILELDIVYALWLRDMKKFFRSKIRIIGLVAMSAFFLVFLGMGFQSYQIPGLPSSATIAGFLPFDPLVSYLIAEQFLNSLGLNYMNFLAPGLVGLILLTASMTAGSSIIADRQFGFLKEIMVTPVSRFSIAMGRTLGGVTNSVIQGLLILGISLLMGVKITNLAGFGLSIIFMIIISTSFVSLGVAFASKTAESQGFQLIMNFIFFLLFFLSGALFPLSSFPGWVQSIAYLNPLYYGVDALRTTLVGIGGTMPLTVDFLGLIGFTAAMLLLSTYLFQRTEAG